MSGSLTFETLKDTLGDSKPKFTNTGRLEVILTRRVSPVGGVQYVLSTTELKRRKKKKKM